MDLKDVNSEIESLLTMSLFLCVEGKISFEQMRNQGSSDRSWNNMDYNILVKIFTTLNFMDIISGVSLVWSSWRSACCDPALWKKLDLSTLSADSNNVLPKPYTLSNVESGKRLTKILNSALNLSRGNVTCLVFNYFISINDEHMVCASERYWISFPKLLI